MPVTKPRTFVSVQLDDKTWRYMRLMDNPGYWDMIPPPGDARPPSIISDEVFLDYILYELANPDRGAIIKVSKPLLPE